MLGVRRRAIVVGEGEHLDHLLLTLGAVARRHRVRVRRRGQRREREHAASLPLLGGVDDLRAVLEQHGADELIVTDSDYTDRQLFQIVEYAHRSGVKVRIAPKTTELLDPARRVRPRAGRAAVRTAAARLRRRGLGGQADVRPARQRARHRGRDAALAGDRGGDQAHLARAGVLPGPAHRPRRAGLRDVQVPDDGRRRRRAAGRARARERGRGRAVQDPRRPARDVASGGSCGASRSTSSRTCSTSSAAR